MGYKDDKWEEWQQIDPSTAPLSPCQMDFMLYRIGREYCDEVLVRYLCEKGHVFYHFGAGMKRCRICDANGQRVRAKAIERLLPCQVDAADLPREGSHLLLDDSNLLYRFDGACIFETVCTPRAEDFRALNPPKSISIKGQTSWTNSYAYRGRGGGGLMG